MNPIKWIWWQNDIILCGADGENMCDLPNSFCIEKDLDIDNSAAAAAETLGQINIY